MSSTLLAASDPMDHVYQWVYQRFPLGTSDGIFTPQGTITLVSNHVIMQVLAALLLILLVPTFARVRSSGDAVRDLTPRGWATFSSPSAHTFATPSLGRCSASTPIGSSAISGRRFSTCCS